MGTANIHKLTKEEEKVINCLSYWQGFFHGMELLCDFCSMDRQTAYSALKELESKGIVFQENQEWFLE